MQLYLHCQSLPNQQTDRQRDNIKYVTLDYKIKILRKSSLKLSK